MCVQNPGTVVPKLVGELDENLGIDRHGHLVDGFQFPVGQTGLECHGIAGQNSMTECDKTIVGDVVVTTSGGHHYLSVIASHFTHSCKIIRSQ